MTRAEKAKKAVMMFMLEGMSYKLVAYLERLKRDDPLAFALANVGICINKNMFTQTIKKGQQLLSRLSDDPASTLYLLRLMGNAYVDLGELELSERYYLRALDIAQELGDEDSQDAISLAFCHILFMKGKYRDCFSEVSRIKSKGKLRDIRLVTAQYYLIIYELFFGNPHKAIRMTDALMRSEKKGIFYCVLEEIKAICLRIAGELRESIVYFMKSAEGHLSFGSVYAIVPLAKALEISRLTGLEPPPKALIRKAIKLARKGAWAEQAAAQEAEALLKESDLETAEGLLEATNNYIKAYQNTEAFFSGLTAAYLAWETDSPVFTKSLKLIGHLIPLYPNSKKDPILGEFILRVEPMVTGISESYKDKGIRAYLIGKLRIYVEGKEIKPLEWRSRKSALFLIYLLLSSKHRIAADHLFYLLWPRKRYDRKNRELLYQAVSFARRVLDRNVLIVHKHDFYQLEGDVWTDLSELENLVVRSESSHEQDEKESLLAKARELAVDDLLPEFPYDRYIDEYRQYYRRLRKRAFGE
ncbi:MAG: hypothetical protein ABIM74_00880 [candidate division WOR-3 bacterium]